MSIHFPARRATAAAGLVLAAGVLSMAAPVAADATTPAADATVRPRKLTLPAPTGTYRIGTRAVRLVDSSRRDPLVKAKPYRELMVSIWYPAAPSHGPFAPHMAPKAAADWDKRSAPGMGIKAGTLDWAGTTTHARQDAPIDRTAGRLPVVLFTPGDGGPRTLGTALVEDLAGRGYLVITVDHTYEADQVEFPGGRVERAVPLPAKLTPAVIARLLRTHSKIRLADLRFVLGRIGRIDGLSGVADLSKVGILGQSIGGSVAAQLTRDDRRVDAAVNLDGSYVGPVARTGARKPILQFAAQEHTRAGDPSWKSFWTATTGWKREVRLAGAAHGSFTDLQVLVPGMRDFVGTIAPSRSVTAQRDYLAAFFDLHLKGRPTTLFDGADPRYPEVTLSR
ncbi:lipase [Spongiactinospora sp. TRM90649]|uniref:alpha/beta hydrolase family protein n=1 Tax=Spongiactinospora sp. TRM90649 TaxID=3031114 RepID=UPI0023F66E0D|nr:lipase [Spongiactinospora sp. TRM90649]MDF5757750.1 lipase [Spongiactinospora sp. TRM90649]